MNPLNHHNLFQQNKDCPSELDLDRYYLKELSRRDARAIEKHLASCSHCQAGLEQRRQELAPFPDVDEKALDEKCLAAMSVVPLEKQARYMLQKIAAEEKTRLSVEKGQLAPGSDRVRIQPDEKPRRILLPLFSALAGGAVAAAALVLVLQKTPSHPPKPPHIPDIPDEVHVKGSLQLKVFRDRQGRVEKTISGDTFFPNDRLRFKIDVPHPGYLMLIAVEQSGESAVIFPSDGSNQAKKTSSITEMLLPGSVRLDDSLGTEWFYLFLCEHAFSLNQIKTRGQKPGHIETPPACSIESFKLDKKRP